MSMVDNVFVGDLKMDESLLDRKAHNSLSSLRSLEKQGREHVRSKDSVLEKCKALWRSNFGLRQRADVS